MRSHRFYSSITLSLSEPILLPKEASHHCIQVLRYKEGDELVLFNGDGFDYLAQISLIEGKTCQVKIMAKISPNNESPLKIHLYQGIARGEKMDLIIQKSVELGVHQITPLFTERCNVKLDQKRLAKKHQHWQKVAISACEQSGRAFIPKINLPIQISQFKLQSDSIGFYLQPNSTQSIHDNNNLTDVSLLVGPEGGFSDNEINQLKENRISGIQLGARILRTETAGLACIAILQSHFGDI